MNRETAIEMLREDENYYGDFGKQYLSNSDIGALLQNPRMFQTRDENLNSAFLVGGYFHTAILEPHKIGMYDTIDVGTRNSKRYKDQVTETGKPALLSKEIENIGLMKTALEACDETRNLIYPLFDDTSIEYEVPGIGEFYDLAWKGKADILNHEEKLIVDLKTTGDILKFKQSAYKYNYDSQAYIYKQLFGYDLVFVAVDKTTHQIGIFECDDTFYDRGEMKVESAVEVYKQWQAKDFDPKQAFIYEKLT